MHSSNKLLSVVAVVLILLGVGATAYALSTRESDSPTTTERVSTPTDEASQVPIEANEATTAPATTKGLIVFGDNGFDQMTYTFAPGQAITVRNESSMDMQFSSDDHPSHRDHPVLNMGVLGAGESGTFTAPGAGTYKFHDHINDQFEGTLIIK